MAFREWIKEQLTDPSNVLHGTGWAIIVLETVRAWVVSILSHQPPTPSVGIYEAAWGCIAGGVVSDRLGAKVSP